MNKSEYDKHLYWALQYLVLDMYDLIEESQGVAGLHLNGDVAPWNELLAGGRFERIASLEEASEILELGKEFYE